MAANVKVFVAQRGNAFMTDIATWVVEAAKVTGRSAQLVTDRLPQVDGSVNLVVAPHEFFELFDAPRRALQTAATASVVIATEQPGTKWFDLTLDVARLGMAAYDINPHGVNSLRRAGIDARRLQLGAVASMVAPARPRDVDVLFMGSLDDRRGRILADLAPDLHEVRSALKLFSFDRPVEPGTPGLVFGSDKYHELSRASVLLNIHRGRVGEGRPYFEWARMIEAMANGCVVVTEPSDDPSPLVAGTHFIEAEVDQLGSAIGALLRNTEQLHAISTAAFRAVTNELALRRAVGSMLDHVERNVLPKLTRHVQRGVPRSARWRLGATRVAPPVRLAPFRPFSTQQRKAKQLAMAESTALRRLDGLRCLLDHGREQHVQRDATIAYERAEPEVTVIVALYNYADVVEATLTSVLASENISFDLIVVDDHATDTSRNVVEHFLAAHPDSPAMLLAKDANEGLAAARNTAFEHARADLVMVLDADNQLYPGCLRALADALHGDPAAAGAYGILEEFGERRGLRSALAWDPTRLCAANYIDAQAMLRKDSWERLGGYRADDDHVFGWEDWDLWLRLAQSGGHLAFVPQILGRYRVQAGSMIALTNLGHDDSRRALRGRYPTLPWTD